MSDLYVLDVGYPVMHRRSGVSYGLMGETDAKKYLYLLNIQIGRCKSNQFYGSGRYIAVLPYAVSVS